MGVSYEQLSKIVVPQAFDVVIQRYSEAPSVFERLATVRDLTGDKLKGVKKTILEDSGELLERNDFQNLQGDNPGIVGVASAKTRQFARSLLISDTDAEAIVAAGVMPDYLRDMVGGYAESARRVKNTLLTAHYERGVIAAGDKDVFVRSFTDNPASFEGFIYDGKAWFATDHPLRGALAAVGNLTVSAALSDGSLELARVKYAQSMAVDHRGQRISLMPDFVMVPPALESLARRIVESPQLQGTPNNDINPNAGRFEVITNPYLTNSSGWFLGRRGFGLEFYDSGVPEVRLDWIPDTHSWQLAVKTRFAILPTDWRHATAQNYAIS